MLYAILRRSSELTHWPGEAHEVWEADFHPALRGWDSNALGASDAQGAGGDRIKRSFLLVTGGRKRLIDKTPRNALRVPFIDTLFPDARYVFLIRDGRDNINSLINAWRTPRYRTYRLPEPHRIPGADPEWWKFTLYPGWRQDVDGPLEVVCARQWQTSYDAAGPELDAVGDRTLQVRYETFVEDPVGSTRAICAFLGVSFDEAVAQKATDAISKPVNVVTPPERGKWKRENPVEIERVVPLIAPTMERLGYEI